MEGLKEGDYILEKLRHGDIKLSKEEILEILEDRKFQKMVSREELIELLKRYVPRNRNWKNKKK